ncbi:MAG: hypothetical protein AAF727_06115 [Pseudomonadota bacterium]
MALSTTELKPGVILHEVIVGCFKASGTTFDAWCREQGIHRSTAINATYGQSGGDKGKKLLREMIAAAGCEQVHAAYNNRVQKHAHELQSGAAA